MRYTYEEGLRVVYVALRPQRQTEQQQRSLVAWVAIEQSAAEGFSVRHIARCNPCPGPH